MATSPFSVLRFRVIFSISWLIVIADLALLLKWFGLSWQVAVTDSLISNIILLLACLLVMNTLRFYIPRRERYLNILVWCIFLTIAWILLSRWILLLLYGNTEGYTEFMKFSIPVRSSIGFLLIGIMTMISIVWYNWEEQKENEERKSNAEKLAKDAELFKLRQQLQPHFLFNSLNSINALIGSKPGEARKMIQQLSDFLRGTLKKEEQQWVSLKEELQYLQLYLDIEKVRFGNRLSTNIEIDETAEELKLPALLLQPIVENAIKFGLYDTTDETIIGIKADVKEKNLVIQVQNPFDPETSSPKQGTGFGLSSVQRRLYLLFARADLLST
ncbi:MAG: sensor histidine kinase, partial [Chitinophagaceae bacterium]